FLSAKIAAGVGAILNESDPQSPASGPAPLVTNAKDPNVRDFESGETLKASDVKKTIEADLDINKVPLEFANQVFTAEDILQDKLNLLPQDFKIPSGLKERVG